VKRYGIDTNLLIRMLTDDDPAQRVAALEFGRGLGRAYEGFLPLTTLLELDWALRSQLGFAKRDVIAAIRKLLHTRGLHVESHTLVLKALKLVEDNNADLADAFIALKSLDEGCETVKTFDIKAARRVPGMELLT
jgi:predicted nucleic-acid-binding protein